MVDTSYCYVKGVKKIRNPVQKEIILDNRILIIPRFPFQASKVVQFSQIRQLFVKYVYTVRGVCLIYWSRESLVLKNGFKNVLRNGSKKLTDSRSIHILSRFNAHIQIGNKKIKLDSKEYPKIKLLPEIGWRNHGQNLETDCSNAA